MAAPGSTTFCARRWDRCRSAMPVIAFMLLWSQGAAQIRRAPAECYDTTCVRDLSLTPTLRAYLVHKFNGLNVGSQRHGPIELRPNRNINMGLGISYRRITLNVAFPIPFVNDDDDARGDSRTLDAQANVFGVLRVTNLFLQVSRGQHMPDFSPAALGWSQPTERAYRADLREFNLGLSTMRVVDPEHFSYRAAFNQDAWQKRSASTWLFGGYATVYTLRADSAIVPWRLRDPAVLGERFSSAALVDAGLMGGRAHTWVHRQHWFFSASVALGAGCSYRALADAEGERVQHGPDLGVGLRAQWRASLGHAGPRHFIGVLASQETAWHGLDRAQRIAFHVGNVRLVYAYHLRERRRELDRGLHWLRKRTPMGDELVPEVK